MEKIVFAGSFDPLTNGHLWVIKESLEIADKLIVFVAENVIKNTLFDSKERKKMIEDSCRVNGFGDKVEVLIVRNEYVAKKASQMGATHLIRGIRIAMDFDYEELIHKTNVNVLGGSKTLFVMPPRDLENVSSAFVKSLIGPVGWHWHVKEFVPQPVYYKILEDFIGKIAKTNINSIKINDFLNIVFSNYSNKDRYYHNLEHIVHCLQEMLWLQNNSNEKLNYEQICAAILAHDIVYGLKQDICDEVLSANLLLECLGVDFKFASNLVLATQHSAKKKAYTLEEKIIRSIDLTILGQDNKLYQKYAENVRKEYGYMEDSVYIAGRKIVLEKFLAKEKIFEDNSFSHYELMARQNIKQELIKLN
jgi:pantetheine-phosphate adenylyltransferase